MLRGTVPDDMVPCFAIQESFVRESCSFLIFLNDMNLQIVKINALHKIILRKPGLFMALELRHIEFEPDRFSQIKFIAYLLQRRKYFVCSGIRGVILYDGIPKHMVIFKNFSPESEHGVYSFPVRRKMIVKYL